jgi:hypothetical protein
MFHIWSIEHDAWWRVGGFGYTTELAEAGHFTGAEAQRIVTQANIVRVNECAIPVAYVKHRESYCCPRCGARSFNPNDIRERYCGACREFADEASEQ